MATHHLGLMACGKSNVTYVTQIYGGGGTDDDDDDFAEEIEMSSPAGVSGPTINFQNEHIELVLRGGEAVPVIKSRSDSGAIELTGDMSF